MLTLARRIMFALLYDEDLGARWLTVALSSAGLVLTTGGNVPGTEIVLPGVAPLQFLGPWMLVAGIVLSSLTSSLPKDAGTKPPDPPTQP